MTDFSIVTVVYNDVLHIKETMGSVVNQNYKEVEYILIDGGSTDGTKEAILEHISLCSEITLEEAENDRCYLEAIHKEYPTFTFKFLSEKDKGIYDAMNKGISLATKEWINFLNCGDKFYNSNVLEEISKIDIDKYDVLYGDLNVCYIDQKIEIIKKTSRNLSKLYALFSNFGHPNCFVKTQLHKKNYFNIYYKLAADYDLVYRLHKQGKRFGFVDIVITTFESGGASDTKSNESLKEALKIAIDNSVSWIDIFSKIYPFYSYAKIKKIIKKYFPKKISTHILKLAKK